MPTTGGPGSDRRPDASRVDRYLRVAGVLEAMSDASLLTGPRHAGTGAAGIGGRSWTMTIDGVPVFVKLLPLTDRERDAGPGDTSNLFALPPWYQYGVGEGSAGFNVWREVAAHRIVSGGVLGGEYSPFPILYHWREVSGPLDGGEERAPADVIDRAVRFWGGSPAVERRLKERRDSRAGVALCLEYVPDTLHDRLPRWLAAGQAEAERAIRRVEMQLFGAIAALRAAGMSHFDAHSRNILTDGRRLRLADFGLATAARFQLDEAERRFLRRTSDHDLAYCVAELVNAIVGALIGPASVRERHDYVRRCADTGHAAGLGGGPAHTVVRYAETAAIVNDFYWRLHAGDVAADFPAPAIGGALQRADLPTTACASGPV